MDVYVRCHEIEFNIRPTRHFTFEFRVFYRRIGSNKCDFYSELHVVRKWGVLRYMHVFERIIHVIQYKTLSIYLFIVRCLFSLRRQLVCVCCHCVRAENSLCREYQVNKQRDNVSTASKRKITTMVANEIVAGIKSLVKTTTIVGAQFFNYLLE